jgi:hypothetical protein
MTDQVGIEIYLYPEEMNLLVKVFNHFDQTQLNEEEQIMFNKFVDDLKDQVLNY